jgi:hypothetical protein
LSALASIGASSALIGGIAVSIRTRPRATKDVDLQVSITQRGPDGLDAAMQSEGFELAVVHANGAIRRYRDPLFGVAVDLLLAEVPLEEAVIAHATKVAFGELTVRVARSEELLALKILASRPDSDDLRDARWLLGSAGESLDLDAVRAHLSPFGPEHLARLEALLRGG